MRRNKGITLVALVITIIVLIILAGVSINAVMSDGLIGNAKLSKTAYDEAKDKEEKEISHLVIDQGEIDFLSQGIPYKFKSGYIEDDNDEKIKVGYLTGIEFGTTVAEFLAGFPQNEGYAIYENDTATTPMQGTDRLGTGRILKKGEGETKETVGTIVVFGDCDCDGFDSAGDAAAISFFLGGNTTDTSTISIVAMDVNHDGVVNIKDLYNFNRRTIGEPIIQNEYARDVDNLVIEDYQYIINLLKNNGYTVEYDEENYSYIVSGKGIENANVGTILNLLPNEAIINRYNLDNDTEERFYRNDVEDAATKLQAMDEIIFTIKNGRADIDIYTSIYILEPLV